MSESRREQQLFLANHVPAIIRTYDLRFVSVEAMN